MRRKIGPHTFESDGSDDGAPECMKCGLMKGTCEMKNSVKVVQDKDFPLPVEVIATSIEEIAEGMKRLNSTRLTRKAIVTLIHANSKVNKDVIELVLNNLEQLEQTWLKRKL
jgi:hypothetical protein